MRVVSTTLVAVTAVVMSCAASHAAAQAGRAGAPPEVDPYSSSTTGNAYSPEGAEIRLRASTAKADAYRTVGTNIKAETWRMRRVRLTADVEAKNVTGRARLWLSVAGRDGVLITVDGNDQAITGTRTTRIDLSILIPESATTLNAGVALHGNGDVVARRLRIVAGAPVPLSTPPSLAAKQLLDSAIAVVKAKSVWRDTITWRNAESDVRRAAAGAQTAGEVGHAITMLLQRTGDKRAVRRMPVVSPAVRDSAASRRPSTGGSSYSRAPLVWSDERDIASLAVLSIDLPDVAAQEQYALATHAKLAGPTVARSCRWVIDLRQASGTSLHGVLAALQPFLGATIGGFVDGRDSVIEWRAADSVAVFMPPALKKLERANVAVLIGETTSEAAENIAIAFKGRPYTRMFGGPTTGVPGEVVTFTMPDGSTITLTTRFAQDRAGLRYLGAVLPDVVATSRSPEDDALTAAVRWLKEQKCQ